MEKQKMYRREWVKTALIIFLTVMLVLTFFSNTILNHSLPEVAAQYVQSGTIQAKIRGGGTVSANETYDMTLNQTRKIKSVLVRAGDAVRAGDILLTLEPHDSEELKQAQETLKDMELSYQKSLIEASNSSSTENYEVKRLQEAYNEALAAYRLYTNEDPQRVLLALEKAQIDLQQLEQTKTSIETDLSRAQSDPEYVNAKTNVDSNKAEYDRLNRSKSELCALLENCKRELDCLSAYQSIYAADKYEAQARQDYDLFLEIIRQINGDADFCGSNFEYFKAVVPAEIIESPQYTLSEHPYVQLFYGYNYTVNRQRLLEIEKLLKAIDSYPQDAAILKLHEEVISDIQHNLDLVTAQVRKAADLAADLTKASAAAEAVRSAQRALEDKVFHAELGDSGSLDLQHSKDAITAQKALVELLTTQSDGQDLKANVSGVVSAIHATAGNTVSAETPVITITVADRGYTLRIPVTAEQARQVKIGDPAQIVNYWNGDITATLENIVSDPQNPGGKVLLFRLSGDGVEPGINLNLAIGQKSANYDALVPNSAIRTDSNGTFVLAVAAKPSPLGNRYIATRTEVKVLAADDTMSAVSGLVNGDFVITTASAPIESGSQVRLVDNG